MRSFCQQGSVFFVLSRSVLDVHSGPCNRFLFVEFCVCSLDLVQSRRISLKGYGGVFGCCAGRGGGCLPLLCARPRGARCPVKVEHCTRRTGPRATPDARQHRFLCIYSNPRSKITPFTVPKLVLTVASLWTLDASAPSRSTCFLCLAPCGDVRAMPCERHSWCCALRSSRAAFWRSRSWIGTVALMVEAPRTRTHCRGPCTGGAASSPTRMRLPARTRAPASLPSPAPAISTVRSPGPTCALGVAWAWALSCCGRSASHSVSTEVPCARAASSHLVRVKGEGEGWG